jgi:secreted trypsin-like serine protease
MRRALATIGLVAVGAFPAALGAAPAEAHPAPAGPPAAASVIGGGAGSISEFPGLALIVAHPRRGGPFTCTGTVVSPRVVLTAGHCVEQEGRLAANPPSVYRVVTGVADVEQASRANLSSVSRAIFYPRFETAKVQVDAGLLILSAPVTAPPVRLASAADPSAAGTPIAIAGWGLTAPAAKDGPTAFRAAGLTLKSPGFCKRETRRFEPLYSTAAQLCAVNAGRTAGGCFGDSGGPAVATGADGAPVEVGIVVAGAPKCDPELPTILTEVSGISPWVAGWIAKVERGAPPPPVPQASPPRLVLERAGELAAVALRKGFGDRFLAGTGKQFECGRLGWARARCKVSWRHGDRRFRGTVTISYRVDGYRVLTRASASITSS